VFDWLFEGRLSVYVFLLLIGCLLLVLWWQQRDRRLIYAVSAVGLAALLYFLLDVVRQTPREQVEATIREMADAVNKHDVDRLFRHVSDNFKYRGRDKKEFRERVRSALDTYGVKNARIKNLRFLKEDAAAGQVTVRFDGKADTNQEWTLALPCEVDFIREGDGQWRMKAIRFYNPVRSEEEWDIPGL